MDPTPDIAENQKQFKKSQWLKNILHTLWASPKYCSLCLQNKGEFFPLDKQLAIYEKSASQPLRDVIDTIFNFHIEDLMPNGYICVDCTEKVIHCYTFIENTKKLYKIIENCVNDLNSKATDVNNEIREEVDYSEANVMIVVEYDTETYDHIDDLLSGQYAILSDGVKLGPKIVVEKTQKPLSETNVTSDKTEEKVKTGMTVQTESREMVVAPTPRVIKHPRIEKSFKQIKNKKVNSVKKYITKIISENKSPKSQNESPKSQNEHPKSQNESPKSQNEHPKSQNETPKSQNEHTKSQNESPKSLNECPKPQNESPKLQNESPKSQNEFPESQNDSPTSQNESPKSRNKCPKPQNESPKSQNESLEPQNKSLKSKGRNATVKGTRTVGGSLKHVGMKDPENEVSKIQNEDRVIKKALKKPKRRKSIAIPTPNITSKDGKLLIQPLLTSIIPSTPRFTTYTCSECIEIFTTYRSLKEHEKVKHNTIIYRCRMCSKSYNSQQYLDVHYKTMHSKSRCRFCFGLYESDLNNPDNLNNHLIDEHRKLVYVCKHCDLVYYSQDKLETHVKSAHNSTDPKYTNNKTQCIMCLRNYVHDELRTHKCKFACLDCPVVQKPCIHFNYLTSYREQILSNATKIKCIDCDYTTKRKEHLICHVNREHLEHHPFTCDDCGTQFYTKLSLKTHIMTFHQDLKCEFCDVDFKTPKLLECHRLICQTVSREFICDKCVASFDTEEELRRHTEVGHSDIVFPCTLCRKEFHDELSLGEHHARIHNGIQYKKRRRLIECTLCDITFMNTREMTEHEKTHDPGEEYPCNVCPKTFPTLKKVYIHKQKHYSLRIRCEGCHKSVSNTFITQHLVMCPYYSADREKALICEECGKSFRTEKTFRMHQKVHSKPVACPHCDKMIKPASLKAHMNTKHPKLVENAANAYESEIEGNNEKTSDFQHCPACEFVTKSKPALENHINRIHLKIKPYICPVCNKSFCGKSRLSDHMRTHSNSKACKCLECGKLMANKVCLKMHMRRHTGEHPYECNICYERFRSSSIMKTHRMKKHQDKTICCPLCESMFHMATEMRFHVKKTHWKKNRGPFDYKVIIPEEYHYMFEDRRFQKLGNESDEVIPLL